jgi:hypothetical protein
LNLPDFSPSLQQPNNNKEKTFRLAAKRNNKEKKRLRELPNLDIAFLMHGGTVHVCAERVGFSTM